MLALEGGVHVEPLTAEEEGENFRNHKRGLPDLSLTMVSLGNKID